MNVLVKRLSLIIPCPGKVLCNATQACPNAMQPTASDQKNNPQLAVMPSPLTNVPPNRCQHR